MKHLFYILLLIPFLGFGQVPNLTTKVKLVNEGIIDSIYSFPLNDIYNANEGVTKLNNIFSLGYNTFQYNSGFAPNNILENRYLLFEDQRSLTFETNNTSNLSNSGNLINLRNKNNTPIGINLSTKNANNFFQDSYGSMFLDQNGSIFNITSSQNIELRTQPSLTGLNGLYFQVQRISLRQGCKDIGLRTDSDGNFSVGLVNKGITINNLNWILDGVPSGTAYSNVLTIDPLTGNIRQSASSGLGGGTSTTTNTITNTNNTITSTVNGIAATTSVVTANTLERVGGATSASSNFLRSTVNGVSSTDVPILNNTGLVYTHGTGDLSWGANGIVSSTNLSALKSSSIVGDTKYGYQNNDHSGWIKLDGRAINTLTSTQQTQATNLGITGNLPDTRDKFVKATNISNTNLGQIGGSNTLQTTLTNSNIPLMLANLPTYSTIVETYNPTGGLGVASGGNYSAGTVSGVAITSTPNSPTIAMGNNFPTPITFTNNPINIALNHFIYLGN